jgi:hypothetical protein
MRSIRERAASDDSEYRYVGTSPVCRDCRHRIEYDHLSCAAFPDRIPEEIWNGQRNHDAPYPGDHGIQFEPMTEVDRERKRQLAAEASERLRLLAERVKSQRAAVGAPDL